ncbi:TraB/GumN family protein [Qipengyuania vesicularis]|uniref:TraB/GumN family protein n=1 Tax=Qipengyuania vesicularis TaxID=2867232 RepID=UPI001C88D382|nr:TraB/GumN family protein [Qipengyuania vesicularis]MBX7526744.1 TraB/GumN family protein [Qipengyuania vesicularis]
MRNLKRTLSTTLSAAALAFGLQACATGTDDAPAPVAEAFVPTGEGPALWKVADEDTTIYIFGTVHALPADVDWNSGPVKSAIESSQTLVTEIDMTPESMASMGPLVLGKAMLPEGQTLRGLMNDEQRTAYEAGLAKMGVPAEALDRFEPWFAAINLVQITLQKAGISGENGVETVLEGSVPEGTERDALETVEFQLDIFDSLPIEAQIPFLLETVENPDEGAAMLGRIIDEWKVGNIDQLAEMLQETAEADPILTERLFYARNANWAAWIDERLDTPGSVFMAVGAGHLAGEKSVQDYLAERNISVTRIQ